MNPMLVPLSCIPETWPAGVRTTGGVLARTRCRGDAERALFLSSGFSLDLSAPPCDDSGNPLRLDALEWASDILFNREGPEVDSLRFDLQTNGALARCTRRHAEIGGARWFPNLAGIDSEDEAMRLVVAAALRARVGLEAQDAA